MKPDDGLIAPAGYEIERWPDGSPKMVDTTTCNSNQWWLSETRKAAYLGSTNAQCGSFIGPYRIALRKLPERKLLNFREAVAAHEMGKTVRCVGVPAWLWTGGLCGMELSRCSVAVQEWMLNRTDFYIQENPS